MSYKLFKNFKHAKRKLPEAYLSVQAVDKKLKPSYLWDAFSADISEIETYLEHLHANRFTDHKLDAIKIRDSVLVIHSSTLKSHIESLSASSMHLINISKNVETPVLLSSKEKSKALKPILKCSQEIVSHLNSLDNMVHDSVDYSLCNLSTLFGLLLGYPVLYWFSQQPSDAYFSCLSMIPLKVYKIESSVCMPSDSKNYALNTNKFPLNHQLFSFSIPNVISDQTESVVQNWFRLLTIKNPSNSLFSNLKIEIDMVSLPYVSM